MLNAILGILLSLAAGGSIGYLYYRFIGCRSGGCPITSNVWSVVIFGALMGYLLLYPLWKKHITKPSKENPHESNHTQTR